MATEPLPTHPSSFEALLARQRALRAQIEARDDAVPNLRDFGLDRRAEYEQAVRAFHAETARLWAELHAVARQRIAARATG